MRTAVVKATPRCCGGGGMRVRCVSHTDRSELALGGCDEPAIVAMPGMKTRRKEAQVVPEDSPHHSRLPQQVFRNTPPGARCVDAVLAEEIGHPLEVRIP